MISYQQFTLSNGLQVIVHEDHTSTLAVMDVIYDVGSRDEDPNRTGFAHLFEHLMFGGSANIPNYDSRWGKQCLHYPRFNQLLHIGSVSKS